VNHYVGSDKGETIRLGKTAQYQARYVVYANSCLSTLVDIIKGESMKEADIAKRLYQIQFKWKSETYQCMLSFLKKPRTQQEIINWTEKKLYKLKEGIKEKL